MHHLVTVIIFIVLSLSAYADQAQTINIATYIEPPSSDFIDGQYVGETNEVAKLLSKQLKITPHFIQCPIARCLEMVKTGQADMIVAIRKTGDREKYLSYLTPPFKIQYFPLRFYIRKETQGDIKQFEDLNTLAIGVVRGASYFDKFDRDNTLNKIAVTTHTQLVQMLLKKRIDTFLEREETIIPLVDRGTYQAKIKLATYQYDNAVGSYIAISKKSLFHKDIERLSSALQTLIMSGEIMKILNQYNTPQ